MNQFTRSMYIIPILVTLFLTKELHDVKIRRILVALPLTVSALMVSGQCDPATAPSGFQQVSQELATTMVTIAEKELGRGPQEVGKELSLPPFDLGRYLGPKEPWCSEFVSWVYRTAGIPLVGGEKGWLLRSSRQLKRWFTLNALFLSPDDNHWDTHEPMPGDYIRYNNNRGGHSGMVVAVRGANLYTIEGNVTNKVVRRIVRNWRTRSDIDGIGIRQVKQPPETEPQIL